MGFKGNVAIVAGNTGSIAWRVVERFVMEGASVFFSGRRAAQALQGLFD